VHVSLRRSICRIWLYSGHDFKQNRNAVTPRDTSSLLCMIALYLASITMLHGQTLPEYTAAEAKKHIGETARVTDKVCEVSPRHWGDTTLVSVTAIHQRSSLP
jgi:hypothetical protein